MRSLALALCTATLALGCAGGGFDKARREDSAAAYHRFLRDHPSSEHADEARQRLTFVRIRSKPTAMAWDEFVAKWPGSPLLPELRPIVEQKVFERTRALGSVDAYRAFLAEFGSGASADRARGNLAYLEDEGLGSRPAALAAFAETHPQSDFAAEAARTAESFRARGSSAFKRVALLVSFSPSTPGKERLARVFRERAAESLHAVGVQVVPVAGPDDPRGASLDTWLTIRHADSARLNAAICVQRASNSSPNRLSASTSRTACSSDDPSSAMRSRTSN